MEDGFRTRLGVYTDVDNFDQNVWNRPGDGV